MCFCFNIVIADGCTFWYTVGFMLDPVFRIWPFAAKHPQTMIPPPLCSRFGKMRMLVFVYVKLICSKIIQSMSSLS